MTQKERTVSTSSAATAATNSTAATTSTAAATTRNPRAAARAAKDVSTTAESSKTKNGIAIPTQADRDEKIKKAKDLVLKKFGDGSLMTLSEDSGRQVPSISTTCMSLDLALGCGGIPRGRIVEIFGPESSGKTTLTLHLIAEAQRKGGVAAFIDAEHAIDPSYARKLGVDLDNLLVSQPDSGEQALEIVEMLTSSGGVDVVVVDSVAALVPRAELEGEMGASHVGLQARLMSQAMRKLTAIANKSGTSIVFINQIREKIGVMFGSPETTSGGRALKFYASVRLDIRRIGSIKNGEEVIGNRTRVKVVKNKMAPPFRQTEFDIIYNKGISAAGDVLDLAATQKVVSRSGTWYSFGETRLGQGRERALTFLEENQDLLEAIRAQVRASFTPPPEAAATAKPSA